MTVRVGPYHLPGYTSIRTGRPVRAPAVDGFVTWMHARVVDARHRLVPQQVVMLHHVLFKDEAHHRTHCGGRDTEPFYGTGEEDSSLDLPPGYGYRIGRRDRWRMDFMLMNHRYAARKVWIEYKLRVDTRRDLTPVTPYWLRFSDCLDDPIFDVPGGGAAGSTSLRTLTWTPPRDGRIVSAGSHLHGGSEGIGLSEPRCGNRTLVTSQPQYGLADDPIYHVLPQIHEPGPRHDTSVITPTGIPIHAGEPLRLVGAYDGERPHARVMAILHIYVAPALHPPACAPLPGDERVVNWNHPYRTAPPAVLIPLTRRGHDGRAVATERVAGPTTVARGSAAAVDLAHFHYSRPNLSVPLGARVTWRFHDRAFHDVTFANGPRAFSSQYLRRGGRFIHRFSVPGTYRLYCTWHPVDMTEVVRVRGG